MDLTFTPEQTQLRDAVAGYLRDHHGFAARRATAASDTGRDARVWRDFADRLGLLSLADPAPDPFDILVVMEEFGAALAIEPFLETVVIGAGLLRATGGETARALLDGVLRGEEILAFAWAEPQPHAGWAPARTTAVADCDGWRIDGVKSVVTAAPWATALLVSARTPAGISLFAVDPQAAGVTLHPYPTIDGRRAADIRLADVRVGAEALLGADGAALPAIEATGDAATAAICGEALGVMRRMLDDTIAYTRDRRQFGQPLAGFQALQHRIVDMYMQIELATSATWRATMALAAPPAERARAVSVAKAIVGEACRFVGQNAIQLHGGMGMTDALAVGHCFKRATVIEGEYGTTDDHVARYIALAEVAPAA